MSSQPTNKVWHEQASQIDELLTQLTWVALALKEKRATLEEKAIINYLDLLSIKLRLTQQHIYRLSKVQILIPQDYLEILQNVCSTSTKAVDEFLKIVRFNLNFLEQYFEHRFLIHIQEELHLVADLENFITKLESLYPTDS